MATRDALRGVILEVLAVGVVGAIGVGVARSAGLDRGWRELLVASAVAVAAGVLSQMVMVLLRGSNSADAAQAGLAGLVVLMIGTGALAAVAMAIGGVQRREPFVWWLLVFSWTSLIVVAVTAVAGLKASSADSNKSGQ